MKLVNLENKYISLYRITILFVISLALVITIAASIYAIAKFSGILAKNNQEVIEKNTFEEPDINKFTEKYKKKEPEKLKIKRKKQKENPYTDQNSDMKNNALQEFDFDKINELSRIGDHQKFLLDLLTSKDSFVRKKIIDQNLSYLNSRLTSYLDKMGLPHQVVFQNDLCVEITELGRELDFDNLSRGERNRLILGLSFAFRDVWENLYFPINTLFIDELIDSGLDTIGVENAMAILKDMTRNRSKSVWLVSHREELAGRVASVLQVIKENGFTTYNSTRDMENL